jgi:hypothetical protein
MLLMTYTNEATYDSIYDRERGLMRDHRPLHFDFNVVARRGRPVEDIMGADAPTLEEALTLPSTQYADRDLKTTGERLRRVKPHLGF